MSIFHVFDPIRKRMRKDYRFKLSIRYIQKQRTRAFIDTSTRIHQENIYELRDIKYVIKS